MKKIISLAFVTIVFSVASIAQLRKIPASVTEAFARRYPMARQVEYRDLLTEVQVSFVLDSAKMLAKYNNKGDWKETDKEWTYDKLPAEVKDGFLKSKYANDWKVTEAAIIYLPDGKEHYRLKVEKNDVQKKYLFFNKMGRLLRDALTI